MYLLINDTDCSGCGYVVGPFPDQAAVDAWMERLEERAGADWGEPFGFRAEVGTAARLMPPAEALDFFRPTPQNEEVCDGVR